MAIQVTWLGHSAFHLVIEGYHLLIDPFLSHNPLAPVQADTIPADFIAVTHGHGDHIGDTAAIAKRTGATVISNVEIAHWLEKQRGLENHYGLNTGGGVQLPFGRIELTHALHSSVLPDGTYGGQPNGILITANDGTTLYHAGDTAPFMDMQLIGERGLDLAMLPIGDYYTMDPAGALRAIELLHPKAVIPMHYNTFDMLVQDVAGWAQRVQNETDCKPVVLDPGGTYNL
jgi:L-ascorbate metabolism protein UlaG (beta-lactamase superfamily)